MPRKSMKKILAGYSIAGLLTATVFTAGCSDRPGVSEKQAEQNTPHEEEVVVVDEADKTRKSHNKEIKIRGKAVEAGYSVQDCMSFPKFLKTGIVGCIGFLGQRNGKCERAGREFIA